MIATGKLVFRFLLLSSALLAFDRAHAQSQPAQPQPSESAAGTIHGIVTSGNMPIPGAAVSISPASSSQKISVWTDVVGSYSATVPSNGSYTVQVQMVAFANSTRQVVIDASHQNVAAHFELTLLSLPAKRVLSPEVPTAPPALSVAFKLFLHCRTWLLKTQAAIR
jgi:hypothetical protein